MPERQTLNYVGNCSTGNDLIARPYTQSKKIHYTGERIDFGLGAFTVTTNALFQANGVEVYDSDCDDLSNAQPSFMANISSSGLDVLYEVPHSDNTHNNMINQSVQAMSSSEQSSIVNLLETKITSDSNIIPYSQYLHETQQAAIQNSNSSAQQDAMILSNVEIDHLKQTLSEQLKEKESLMKTVIVLKNDFKKEESRNIDREIALENKIKLLDNIKAQQFEPRLYDGNVIKNTSAIVNPDSEETLMLAEKSRSKMLLKQQDPEVIAKKVNTILVDYATLNKLSQDFKKQFVPQTELSTEQAFWSQNSINSLEPSPSCTPTKVEVPKELLKAIEQHRLESKTFKVKMNQVLNENDRLLEQVITKDIVNIVLNSSVDNASVNVHDSQSQEIDTVIRKLKEIINSLSGNVNEKNVKKDIDEIEPINIELEHSMAKLISENENLRNEREHLKSIFKVQFDSIKKTRVQSKEHSDSLIAQINAKFVENSYLNAQLQEKVFIITTLKEELRKLKGKSVVDCSESVNKPNVIALVMLNLDWE
ncbi:hypothetical protein Tco_0438933 [Tanacetum coccineum]